MKLLIWIIAGCIALAWTGTVAVSAAAASWAAAMLESGQAVDWAREAAQWPIPRWVTIWVDPALLRSLQEAAIWSVETLHDALPFAQAALDWLVPAMWVMWGVGMLFVLGLAAGLHWLANSRSTGMRPA
jgi:hypothetical protein